MLSSTTIPITIRKCVAVAAIASALLVQGCATYEARVADGKPDLPEYKGGTMNALLFGVYVDPEIQSAETCRNGMYDVVAKNNYLYSLASVITLGIWMPLDVEFRCKAGGLQGDGTVPP